MPLRHNPDLLDRFGEQVRKRELGLEEFGDAEEFFPTLANHQLAAKGELALEFRAEVERVEMERTGGDGG